MAIDISTASSMKFLVLKPDGTTTTWTAEFADDGADGVIQYTTVSGDLDQSNIWYIQAQITFASGVVFTAARQRLLVHPTVS